MKLNLFTIVLNGQPFIEKLLPEFERLKCDWHWYVMEGASANTHDTKWCTPQSPQFSRDGTHEYLNSLIKHPRVTVLRKQLWDGKIEMVNAPLNLLRDESVLMQVDSDEWWDASQLETVRNIFVDRPQIQRAYFKCRYFYGQNIYIDPDSDKNNVWLRAWRHSAGQRHVTHEPPNLAGNHGPAISADETSRIGLVFQHYSYVTRAQVHFKSSFYSYKGAVESWERLQSHTQFPCKAISFFKWASPTAVLRKGL